MADAVARDIAVMRAFDPEIVALVVKRGVGVGRPADLRVSRGLGAVAGAGELGEGVVLEGERRMRRGRAGEEPPFVVLGGRRAAIDDLSLIHISEPTRLRRISY